MAIHLEWAGTSPDAYTAMLGLEKVLAKAGLERPLIELVYLRTSQISSCVYCVNMHANDTRKADETERRPQALCIWQGTFYSTLRGCAALAWTERLACLGQGPSPHGLLDGLREHLDDKEITELTLAVSTINTQNRFGVGIGIRSE